jgi:hypothetical protein
MSLFYAIQDLDWADSRFRFQTDVTVECTDLAFTPWGMEEGLELGELCQTVYKDLTGIYTGRPYYKYAEDHIFTVNLKDFVWGTYDTKKLIDPSQGRKQYVFDKEEVVIHNGVEGTYVETKPNLDDIKTRTQSVLNQMATRGYKQIYAKDLWSILKDMGVDYNHRVLGTEINLLGLERKQYKVKGVLKDMYLFPNHPDHSMNRQPEKEAVPA